MKKHIKTLNLFFSLFLSGLIFFSCTNIFTSDSPEAKSSQNSTGKIKLQGSVAIPDDEEGATSSVLMDVLKNASLEQGEERSASYSELPAGYDFFAVATRESDGLVVGAAADECIWMGNLRTGNKSFAMNLDYGHWTVKAGIKKSGAALNPAEADIIYVSEEPIDLPEGAPLIYTKSFKPKPRQISSGSIGLDMTKTTEIDFVTATLISGSSSDWQSAGFGSGESGANISITADTVTFSAADIKSGAYIVLFKYYDCDDFITSYSMNTDTALASRTPILVYSTLQTISVYDNLETNRWVKSVGDVSINPITDSGSFVLTDAILASYSLTNLHVSSTGSDSNSGSAYQPFATLSKAVSYIEKQGSSTVDYTITVSGECVGATEMTSALNGKANSITIQGKNTPAASSSPTDALVGDSGGTGASQDTKPNVLKVETRVPLYVKNIKITKLSGYASRGIHINNADAKVYLQNGTELSSLACGNSQGGAVYVTSGKLYVEGAVIKGNEAGQDGGAIYIDSSGQVEISSGEISGNESSNVGGAIRNNGSLTITGGIIKDNTTTSSDFNKGGGAIYAASGSTTKIGGTARIPYGVRNASNVLEYGCGKNEICLSRSTDSTPVQAKLTLTRDLSNHNSTSNQIGLKVNGWKRGTEIIEAADDFSLTADVLNKFKTVDEDFRVNTKNISGSVKGVLTGDIVVAVNNSATYNAANVRGTSSEPYKTIADALANAVDSENTTITVSGIVSGAQTITSVPDGVTELLIKGKTTAAKIDAGGTTGAGSALTVDANGKTVTIQDLTITGGYTASNGGGINITAGTVKLVDGAKITGNIAEQYGGGVCLAGSDSKLFMSGSSLIGDSATSTRLAEDGTSADLTTFANKAVKSGGGIYNNGGSVYIGYSGISSGTPQKSDMTSGYGVRRNYAGNSNTTSGGGIQNSSGTLTIASGSISYNQHYNHGGGIYIADGEVIIEAPVNSSNAAKLEGNKAIVGGAIYNGKKLTMNAGQIGGSTSTVQNTVAGTDAMGGAIYQGGTFTISGSAVVCEGSEKTNDVFLPSTDSYAHTISVGSLSGGGTVASITPKEYKRGINILSSSSALSDAVKARFSLTKDDAGWERKDNTASTTKYVYITSPIYVASSEASDSTRKVCSAAPSSGNNGTKTSPYATIAAALADSELSKVDYTITIDGKLSAQTISSTTSVASGVNSVTLQGYKPSGVSTSSAQINGGGSSSALSIGLAKSFTIKDLGITNGRSSAGGGINITSGSGTIVNLDSGAKVYSNKVTSGGTGAGVCVASGATLNIKSGSEIYSNAAYSGTINGGGVYNGGTTTTSGGQIYNNSANNGGGVYNGGSLYVTGTSLIGDGTANNNTATGANPGSNCSNLANYGGGIYNNGNLYFGCDSNGSSSTTGYALTASYGVRRNNATQGGGIYLAGGTFKAASGTVSYNHAAYGGAIYVAGGVNNLGAVTLASNNVNNSGGALYLANSTSLTVSGAADFNANSVEITSGSNNPRGGAVYNSGTLEITASATFKNNVAKVTGGSGSAYGGAIYNGGTLTMTAGTIGAASNLNSVKNTVSGSASKAYGGAIYQGGTFNVSGTAYVYPGSETSNDVYLASGKTVAINGDWSGLQASTSKMTLTPANWTRGTTVVSKGASFSSNLGGGIIGKFAPSDSEWSAVLYGSGASAVGKIDADIWVAGSGTLTSCSKAGNDSTGNGTKAKPYASIATAVGQCWGGPKDTATGGRIINVEGTVTAAANTEQTISSGITSAKATAIKLLGNGSGVTLKPASGKRVLSIYTAVPVTIQNLTISGGSTTDNGAGIYVSAAKASLTLTTSAVVTGANTTSANGKGGGIYIAGSSGTGNAANLIMNGTAQISGNSASGTAGAGGGVYLYYANLCMSGNALIGDTSGSAAATNGSTGHSNMAKNGGGVYCDTGSNVYLGFASASDSGTALSKGIRRNYASSCGGGIYVNGGTVTLKTGYVSYNGTAATSDCDGGGIWQKSGTTVTISGGTIAKNKGYYGGGVYAGGTFTMSGGTIGDSSTSISTAATSTSYSNYAAYGGGIYAPSGASVSLNSGYVSYNYASEQGGGIKAIASITFKSNANYNGTAGNGGGIYANTFSLSSGTIKGNEAAGNGGGIACAVNASYTLTISGGTVTANKALNGGGVYGGAIGMTGGTVSSNTATNTAVTDEYCGGGGIFADTYYLVLTGGSIQGNISKGNGGGVLMRDSYLYMSGSAVIGNSGASAPPDAAGKTNSNNADYDGGGIYANCDGAVYIGYTNSIPTNQTKAVAVTSMAGGVYYNYCGRDGGGICNYSSSGVKIAKGNIKYNASPSGNGGGVCFTNGSNECFIYDGSVDGNKALNGGGVYLDGVSLTMSGGTVSANTATNNSTTNPSKNGGGGVYLNDPTNGAKYFKMTAGTIAGNTSKKNGGGLLINGGKFYMSGTAVIGYAGAGTSTDASTCDDSNKADDCGGGIYAGAKSEVYIGYSDSSTLSQMSSYEVSCIRCNYAKNYGGGLYTLNYNTTFFKFASGWIAFNRVGSSGYGAGIYHSGKATSYIGFSSNSYGPDIVANSSGNAREYFYGSTNSLSSQRGGGIYNVGVITFSKGNIRSNYAKEGGGVYNASGATFTMNGANAVIGSTETYWGDDNNAIDGAGVHNGGTFTISSGYINKNRSHKYGAGVYNWGGTFTISGGQINNNAANKYQATYDCEGGGIYISGGTVTVSGGSVSSNECGTDATSTTNCGGNIAFSNGTFSFEGGEVKGGYSKGYGNSIYAAKVFTMKGNAHTEYASGGEIYLASSACINIPANLTYKSSNTYSETTSIALITPASYTNYQSVQVLKGSYVSSNNKKFNVSSNAGYEYVVASTGYLRGSFDN